MCVSEHFSSAEIIHPTSQVWHINMLIRQQEYCTGGHNKGPLWKYIEKHPCMWTCQHLLISSKPLVRNSLVIIFFYKYLVINQAADVNTWETTSFPYRMAYSRFNILYFKCYSYNHSLKMHKIKKKTNHIFKWYNCIDKNASLVHTLLQLLCRS